jgi:HAE1 family hydrophobic/amphiphilic exporter-1
LPVSFLSSVTGRMLYQFGMTAVVAIMISMLISFSLTPMMCSRLLRPDPRAGSSGPRSRRGFYHLLEVGYVAALRFAMRFRWLVCIVAVAVIASNFTLYRMVKQDYVPTNVDESEFEIRITAQEGASLLTMNETTRAVEQELKQIPGITHLLTTVGSRSSSGMNNAEIYVQLEDIHDRSFNFARLWHALRAGTPSDVWKGNYSQRDVMQDARRRLSQFEELIVSVRNLTSLRQGAPVDIDFVIEGPDIKTLAKISDELRQRVAKLPGIVDTYTTLRMDKPELRVEIDRERAAALGVEVHEIAETLRIAVGGDDRVSRYHDEKADDTYDVELRLVGIDRSSRQAISQLYVRTSPQAWANTAAAAVGSIGRSSQGSPAPHDNIPTLSRLDNVVQFAYSETSPRIDRVDRQRMAAVRANLGPGYALADRIEAIKDEAKAMGLPPGYVTRISGRGRELERTFQDFGWTFTLSFIFMYLVLAAQFEHLIHPLTILISLPLAVPFGLASLLLGGETLNLYSALGILVLFGVVKKNSILQVDHTNQLRAQGLDRLSAIVQANRDRLRPILMTTIAFVAGLMPLLIAAGPGAEERRSIAVLAVGGQTLSLLLTLLATPVIYSIFDDMSQLFWSKQAPQPVERSAIPAPSAAPKTPQLVEVPRSAYSES